MLSTAKLAFVASFAKSHKVPIKSWPPKSIRDVSSGGEHLLMSELVVCLGNKRYLFLRSRMTSLCMPDVSFLQSFSSFTKNQNEHWINCFVAFLSSPGGF